VEEVRQRKKGKKEEREEESYSDRANT